MKLNEAESKTLFREAGIPTPRGAMARSPAEVTEAVNQLKTPNVVLKSLILTGGRGKAGAILKTQSDSAAANSKELFGHIFKGYRVDELLVEETVNIQKEYYLSITFDREHKSLVLLFSGEGGMDIEQLAEAQPEKIFKYWFHFPLGDRELTNNLTSFFRGEVLDERIIPKVVRISACLAQIMENQDASLVEINPLVQTPGGMMAADAKIVLDDNALFRHPEWLELQHRDLTKDEQEAKKSGIQYVELNGDIGVIGNGAGLVMATLDVLQYYKGKPANFCDVGGGANTDTVLKALQIVERKKPKAILVNIFGGITQVDLVAEGIAAFRKKSRSRIPLVVRIEGRHRKRGQEILNQIKIPTLHTIEKCAQAAIQAAGGNE